MGDSQPTANLEDYADLTVDKRQTYLWKFISFAKQFYVGDTGIINMKVEYYRRETCGRLFAKGYSSQKLNSAEREAAFVGVGYDIYKYRLYFDGDMAYISGILTYISFLLFPTFFQ